MHAGGVADNNGPWNDEKFDKVAWNDAETGLDCILLRQESGVWGGCIDCVGGQILARAIKQMNYGCGIASLGNTAGGKIEASIMPFWLWTAVTNKCGIVSRKGLLMTRRAMPRMAPKMRIF